MDWFSDWPGGLNIPEFDKTTPVLRFNRGMHQHVRWVLWPVCAWKVVAPVRRERTLNLFQRAILGLSRAGVTQLVDMADRLLIAPDLAALIVLELQGMAMLDHDVAPTTRGLKTLEDIEEETPEDVQVGHVISDALGGKLWPRFLQGDLPVADVEPNEEGWPVLLSGSAGDPWKDPAFCLLPSHRDAPVFDRPSARDVLRAAQRDRRQSWRDEEDSDRDVPLLHRVSFVDQVPQPYLFALRLRRHESGDWTVDDPFSSGEALDLRARLEERLDTNPALRKWMGALVGADPAAPTLADLQVEAGWKVEERMTLAIRQHPDVLERLVAMQRALLEASSPDAPLDKWDDVLVKAQRAVERALHTVEGEHEGDGPPLFAALAASDREFNRRLLDTIAAELGFRSPLPASLSCVRRGKVQAAEQGRGGSLRPRVLLGLLRADRVQGHPLRPAAVTAPDLLHRLDGLATARDRAAHDGTATWPGRVQEHVDTTYGAVRALLLTR